MEGILNYQIFSYKEFSITTFTFVQIAAILLVMRLITFLARRALRRYFLTRGLDEGRAFVISRFFNYAIYIITFLLIINVVGISMSGLMLGSAGLLVGIGFGLQRAFSDFVSGLILMVEGDISVGDKVVVDNEVGIIRSIGVRSSKVTTRDEAEHIIPNSNIVENNIVNLSMNAPRCRFFVNVGVSYGSDPENIRRILLQSREGIPGILDEPPPSVQFTDFGDSSLDFKLFFYTQDYLNVPRIKSDLRFRIFQLFKENKVEIPFPQRDLWVKSFPAANPPEELPLN